MQYFFKRGELVLQLGSTVADDCNLFVFFRVLQRNCKLRQILVKKTKWLNVKCCF